MRGALKIISLFVQFSKNFIIAKPISISTISLFKKYYENLLIENLFSILKYFYIAVRFHRFHCSWSLGTIYHDKKRNKNAHIWQWGCSLIYIVIEVWLRHLIWIMVSAILNIDYLSQIKIIIEFNKQ